MSDIIDKTDPPPPVAQSPAGLSARTSVKDLQENFTKTHQVSKSTSRDSFSPAERKQQFDVANTNITNNTINTSSGLGSFTSTMEKNTDFVKLSTVSRRLEDWRKKSSNDFQLGLGKRSIKEEHELMNDVNDEKLADNESCEEEAESCE